MRALILGLLTTLAMGTAAHAQDFGLTAGLSGSSATGNNGASSGSYQFGFRLGGVASFPLTDNLKFRTGLLYTQRHFQLKDNSGNQETFKYDYLDIPVLLQVNLDDSFGIFGGIVAAFNVNNTADGDLGSGTGTGTKSLYPLIQVGLSGTFSNMYGLEAYYEYGLGDIYDGAKNYSVFGVNFVYWL